MSETTVISAEVIKKDPYNYTCLEMVNALGEDQAKSLFKALYTKNPAKYQTLFIKDIYDGGDTRKYAFELEDHYCIETVCIRRKTGTTACISTMVGCPVGCVFCESGKNGFIRNLTPSEIVQQVVLLKESVNRIVVMGMGEPLFNYENLIKAIHILRDRDGLNFPTDGITVSTVGPLQQLKKLREEHVKIQLTLSLHATNQRVRDIVIPHMKANNIQQVVDSVLDYSVRHNRKITIAYLLLPGLNDTPADVRQLGRWFRGKNVLINLLQYNETSNPRLKRPNKQELVAFKIRLEQAGLEVIMRESRGNKIKAACGQLVSEYNKKSLAKNQSSIKESEVQEFGEVKKTARVKRTGDGAKRTVPNQSLSTDKRRLINADEKPKKKHPFAKQGLGLRRKKK